MVIIYSDDILDPAIHRLTQPHNHICSGVRQFLLSLFILMNATKIFDERLKAAASLWKIVRDSDMKKEYSHELFEKYKDSITI